MFLDLFLRCYYGNLMYNYKHFINIKGFYARIFSWQELLIAMHSIMIDKVLLVTRVVGEVWYYSLSMLGFFSLSRINNVLNELWNSVKCLN